MPCESWGCHDVPPGNATGGPTRHLHLDRLGNRSVGHLHVDATRPGRSRDVASLRTAAATVVAHVFSWIGSGFVVFPVALACCVALFRRRRWAAGLAVALSTVGAQVIIDLDKLLVGRHRPQGFMLVAPRRLMYGAAVAGGVLIACVGFSRVYLGVHYPSDVVAGAVLGFSWSLVASRLARLWRSADERVESATGAGRSPSPVPKRRPPRTCTRSAAGVKRRSGRRCSRDLRSQLHVTSIPAISGALHD